MLDKWVMAVADRKYKSVSLVIIACVFIHEFLNYLRYTALRNFAVTCKLITFFIVTLRVYNVVLFTGDVIVVISHSIYMIDISFIVTSRHQTSSLVRMTS